MTEYRQINMDTAKQLMKDESGYLILDVRSEVEYEAWHIPRAVNVPLETIGSKAKEELPVEDQMIMVYCRSGVRSKIAAAKLVELGYTNIVEFGGINEWNGETEVDY